MTKVFFKIFCFTQLFIITAAMNKSQISNLLSALERGDEGVNLVQVRLGGWGGLGGGVLSVICGTSLFV